MGRWFWKCENGDVASGAGPIIVAFVHPQLSVPQASVPQLSIPQLSIPQFRRSLHRLPSIAVPAIIIPAIIVPPSVVPAIDLSPLGTTISPSFRL
ncbi:hypothetical protein BS47DRAFT_1397045 [Hydnum rufescens UP504]|uniref:Uncharacterized protein n=1 Tax=Hydnum rufescens UP504 TaxID=1448309 RepID=A0A9P6DPQ7_9AGAM|nr:hypothetical protein BS47DRAFT_1397045 [Hydnum rufescens UP504]